MKNLITFILLSFLFCQLAVARAYLGPCDIVVNREGTVFLIEKDSCKLRVINKAGERVNVFTIPFEPERMVLLSESKVAVVGGEVDGKLLVIDTAVPNNFLQPISVGHTPSDVAFYRDDVKKTETVYVANRFSGDISVVDLGTKREVARWLAGREPIALQVTPDGKKLIVAGHIAEDSSLSGGVSSRLRFFDTATGTAHVVSMQTGTINVRDVVLSPDGRYAFATGTVGHFEQTPSNVEGGWMNENLLFVFDIQNERLVPPFYYLDDYGNGAGNPWGVTVSDCGRFLVVACAGSCEIILVNLPRLVAASDRRDPSDDAKMLPIQMRIPFGLKGLRRAVMNDSRILAIAYFEDAIARVDLKFTSPLSPLTGEGQQRPLTLYPDLTAFRSGDEKSMKNDTAITTEKFIKYIPLKPLPLMKGLIAERSVALLQTKPVWTDIRRGEMLFNDAMICREHWQSCATCHPDGRADCLNWDLLNDGIGNPKNTKSMILSHETPPCMAHGIRKSAEVAVRSGIHSILFTEQPEEDACCIDEYLKQLKPVTSPKLVDGKLSEAAKHGKLLFDGRAGCSDCHPAPLFTDLLMHDVNTQNARDTNPRFDTPTLIECWRTSPYLHDGRYVTMRELLVDGQHYDTNGQIKNLTEQDIDDLVEYVLSL
ncbi:MAG: hypothetical protein LBU65_00320 [Planctomycetaceae bacterium]|jgi:DNA-binding beta-propeller fold protein YncE|nr:hypothetical protein [Planctomycetaceae bacterium]